MISCCCQLSATDPFSRLIRWATKSPWSHVAIAYRLEAIDRVLVLECVEKIGVRAVPLSSFISRTSEGNGIRYPGKILLARHGVMAARVPPQALDEDHRGRFAFERLGDKFSPGRRSPRSACGSPIKKRPSACRNLNCIATPGAEELGVHPAPEYVARCFQNGGRLEIPWDGLEGFVAPDAEPTTIANDPRVEAVAMIRT